MKKTLRIVTITAILAAAVLIAACKQFLADPEEFFSYWAAEVIGTDYSIDKPQQMNKDGIPCVPSADDVTVTITLRNPKSFRLVMPTAPSDAGNVIIFPGLSPQPVYGTDYSLGQPAPDKLALTYKPAFLKAHEWSNGDISPEITFTADDGRKFSKKFSMNLKVNTAPALEYAGICQTATADSDGNHFYVLIFRVKDMDDPITAGSIHKDIKKLIVTAGGVPSEIPLSFNAGKTDFETGGDLLAQSAVRHLDIDHPLPWGNWLLRLKTDVKVGGPEKVYEVCIKDEQGLSSEVIRASTQKNKLPDVELFDGSTTIPEPAPSLAGAEATRPKDFPGINGKTLTAQAPASAAITGSIAKRNSDGTWTQISGGTVSGTTTAAVNLPALAASGTEALYKITLKASLTGYADSDPKDFFVRLIWQEIPVLKLKQDFSSGDNNLHSISAGTKAYVTEDIIPDAGYYNNNANALVIYNDNPSSPAVKLELSASAGSTVKYELDSGAEQSAPAPAEITVTDGTHKLEVWAESSGIPGPFTTVYINVVNAVSNYTQLKNIVQNAPAGNEIQINIGGSLTVPSGDTEIAVSDGKNLKLIPKSGSPIYTINVNESGRIFKVSGSGTVLNLEDIKLEGGNASTGGAVYVEDGGILKLTGETVITPSTGADINTPGKNDVYLATGTSIKVDNALTGSGTIARITPNYIDGNTVLTGSSASVISSEYTKFSVTQPAFATNLWTIKDDGTLKAIPTTINGSSGAWQRLKEAVQTLPEGSTITVNGKINATNDFGDDDRGVIDITKNITIQGQTGANSDMLNANRGSLGSYAHPIFRVSGGKTLTLKNLTLKGGKGRAGALGGGAILIPSGSNTAELTDCVIEDCTADKGGAIGCGKGSTVTLTNTTIKNCTAHTSGNTGTGGAIYAEGATVTMTGCTLTGNKADKGGGAIYAQKHTSSPHTPSIVTIEGGTIGGTGDDANKANGTGTDDGGGGIYIGEACTLTMKAPAGSPAQGVQLIGNEAKNGGAIFAQGATVNITSCTFTGNEAANGGAVYAIAGDGKLTLTAVNMNNNHAKLKGGAVYFVGRSGSADTELTVQGGEFTGNKAKDTSPEEGGAFALITANALMEGVKIKQNFARQGAGICVGTDGSGTTKLTLTDSGTYGLTEISNNGTLDTLTAENGGGIYFIDGTLVIKNGVCIKQNKAQKGGGIYVIDASCSMFTQASSTYTPEISGNEATAFGAGIYLHKSSASTRLTMSGGKISGNRVVDTTGNLTGEGGGIYTELAAEIRLNKGTIENNQAEKGGAVYANPQCDFSMKSSARITPSSGSDEDKPGQNDAYLEEHTSGDAKIKLDGALTGTAPVARITVADSQYNSGTQVLTADSSVTLKNETYKFAVTPKIVGGTPQPWTVDGNGCLKQGRYTEVPYNQLEAYLANNASSTEVNYIEVTGTIPVGDFSKVLSVALPPDSGELGERLKKAPSKEVALKLSSGLSVTNMDCCFAGCTNLVSLENFPSGVTSMQACFYGCKNLTTVPDIPATVTNMKFCFRYCKELTTALNIPASVYDMTSCFQNCKKLQSIKINCHYFPGSFNGAFSGCDDLPNGGIKVPSGELTHYKNNAGNMGTTKEKFAGF